MAVNKIFPNPKAALEGLLRDGMTIMSGGFGLCGIPGALIEAIRPSLLVKGADYTPETVVGGSFVQSYGGRIMLANLLPGHSTTATVARLRA